MVSRRVAGGGPLPVQTLTRGAGIKPGLPHLPTGDLTRRSSRRGLRARVSPSRSRLASGLAAAGWRAHRR